MDCDAPYIPTERIPPQARESEMCVLGAMLLDPSCIPDVEAVVDAADFYNPAHGYLFGLLTRLVADGKAVDLVTVRNAAANAGELGAIGGVDYLMSLVDGVPDAANVEYYATEVKNKSIQRQIIALATSANRQAYEPMDNPAELLATLESRLYGITHGRTDASLVHVGDAADAMLAEASQMSRGEIPPGTMTGLTALDQACGGMRGGEVIVLAAGTSCGKTTLADTIVRNVAGAGGKVLVVTVEMFETERAKRYLQVISQVNGSHLRLPKSLSPDEWTRLQAAAGELHKMSIMLYAGEATTSAIVSQARRAEKRMGGLDLVVVDYLQLLRAEKDQGRTRAEHISCMTWALKMRLARELNVPLLLLSQVNREGLKEDRPLRVNDLKESGDIENHATAIWLLHRPKDPEKCKWNETWLCQGKHRDMPRTPWTGVGAIRLTWERATTTFTDAYRLLV